jgi:hypothetical protein
VDEKRPFEEPTITELGAVEELTAHGDLLLPDSPHQNALI